MGIEMDMEMKMKMEMEMELIERMRNDAGYMLISI